MRLASLLVSVLIAAGALAQTVEVSPTTDDGRTIQTLITQARLDELRWPDFSDYRNHVHNLYAPNGYALLWSRDGVVTPQARMIIGLFEGADDKGVNAADYDGPRWAERLRAITAASERHSLARFDLALTVTLMRYISDLHIGRINPRNVQFHLDIEGKKYYLPDFVNHLKGTGAPPWALSEIEPRHADYRRLRDALLVYRRLAAEAEGVKPLPLVPRLAPGEEYAALPQLAQQLQRIGDLQATTPIEGTRYDEPLVTAVKNFQSRHGLEPSGVLGEATFRALNVSLAHRLKQIQWALERWRWAPSELPPRRLLVNIPEFVLRGSDDAGEDISMPVVVGRAYAHQTPVFVDEMKYVVFRPYWNVPPNIQKNELVPKVEKDSQYLVRNNYEVVDANGAARKASVDAATLDKLRSGALRIRQKPGPGNALGLVKFIFPNENNVYLHSTPQPELFGRQRRDFSHGCVRVADPVALSAWVLRDQPEWTAEAIEAAMNGKESRTAMLKEPLPIMILYSTVTVDEDGTIRFFEDLYGHDAALEEALATGYPYPG